MALNATETPDGLVIQAGPSPRGPSLRGELLRCPQRFAYLYQMPGIRVLPQDIDQPALRIGTEIHAAAAQHFAPLVEPTRAWAPAEAQLHDPLAKAAFLGAMATLPPWLRAARVIGVERKAVLWFDAVGRVVPPPDDAKERLAWAKMRPVRPFDTPPYPLTLRLDLVVETVEKRVRIVDWKSGWVAGARATTEKLEGFEGSLQFAGNHVWGQRMYPGRYEGVYAVMVNKVAPHKAKTLDVTPFPEAALRLGTTVVWSEQLLGMLTRTYPDPFTWPSVLSEQAPCKNDRYSMSCIYQGPCKGIWPREK